MDKLESGHPVYAQVALHPDIYQFHSPSAEYPISKGFYRPTYAGVITGFNFTQEGSEYWKIYIRRHELHPGYDQGYNEDKYGIYNYVRVAAKFQDDEGIPLNPFAGITSMGYTIDVDEDDRDRGMVVDKLLEVDLDDVVDENGNPVTSVEDEETFSLAVKACIKKMYSLENMDPDKVEQEVEKHIQEIETLYVHPDFFNVEVLNTTEPLNITDVLPNLHTITIDLGEGGEWHEDYPYIIQDFYDFDLTFVDQDHMNRRRLRDNNHGDQHNYKHGNKDPRHPDYKYDGRDYDYSKHYFDELTDDHKNHHIKVTGRLKNLIFGRYTMPFMSLIVMHAPYLEYIYAKDYSFKFGWYIRIEDCENLRQISFGLHTFSDGWGNKLIPMDIRMDLIGKLGYQIIKRKWLMARSAQTEHFRV